MSALFADPSAAAIPLHLIASDALPDWLDGQSDATRTWVAAQGFTGALGQALTLPGEDGALRMALAGYGTASARKRGRFHLAGAAAKLPKGDYELHADLAAAELAVEALGWLLASYRFDRYATQSPMAARLVAPAGIDADHIRALAEGEMLTRDLINTPASDMGPPDLEAAARKLADQHGARISVITGDDLLAQNLPLIHTVGRAADRAPRLIDLTWGKTGKKLTLVGKGVCFDTGGLNLKPGGYHLMLFGLQTPLVDGEAYSLSLLFENCPDVQLNVPVRDVLREGGGR